MTVYDYDDQCAQRKECALQEQNAQEPSVTGRLIPFLALFIAGMFTGLLIA